jgi:DUF1009 family protein
VVGPATLHVVAEAGLAGVAVEAGGVLVLDRKEAIEVADSKGIFLIGVRTDGL